MKVIYFRLRTQEGSSFLAEFSPQQEDAGIIYGGAQIVGTSARTGQPVRIIGTCSLPEAGSKLVVSDTPIGRLEQGPQKGAPLYLKETIVQVEEITAQVWYDAARAAGARY